MKRQRDVPAAGKAALKRAGLVVALLASLLTLAIPAQPAAAGDEGCSSWSHEPQIIDYKIFLLDGYTRAECNEGTAAMTVTSTLFRYSPRTGTWHEVATGSRHVENTRYTYADAYYECGGQNATYKTNGYVKGLRTFGGYAEDYSYSLSKEITCSNGGMPVIDGW